MNWMIPRGIAVQRASTQHAIQHQGCWQGCWQRMSPIGRRTALLVGVLLAGGGEMIAQNWVGFGQMRALAQVVPAAVVPAACAPPKAGEYLLLVKSQTAAAQSAVREAVSGKLSSQVCAYSQATNSQTTNPQTTNAQTLVTRIDGLRDWNTALAWVDYFKQTLGMRAVIARPANPTIAASPAPNAPDPNAPNPSAPNPNAPNPNAPNSKTETPDPVTTTAKPNPEAPITAPVAMAKFTVYNPQSLGRGYAVLVNYYNRPEIAAQIQRTLNRKIGLASYGRRPYLLAAHTTDQAIANSILQRLSDRNFTVMIVDSRRVTLLKPVVNPFPIGQAASQ